MENKVYASDFDGTLCKDKFPEIGEPNKVIIDFVKEQKLLGNKFILWTCRTKDMLNAAVDWCKEQGIEFDAVNENLPETKEKWGEDTRKVFCDAYIDDKNMSMRECIFNKVLFDIVAGK